MNYLQSHVLKVKPLPKIFQLNPINLHNNSQSTQEVTQSPVSSLRYKKNPLLCCSGPDHFLVASSSELGGAPTPSERGEEEEPGDAASVVDDDGPSHPQAGVGVWRGQDQALRLGLGDPAGGDGLTRLPAGVPQLGAGQHPPGPPGRVQEAIRKDLRLKAHLEIFRVWADDVSPSLINLEQDGVIFGSLVPEAKMVFTPPERNGGGVCPR